MNKKIIFSFIFFTNLTVISQANSTNSAPVSPHSKLQELYSTPPYSMHPAVQNYLKVKKLVDGINGYPRLCRPFIIAAQYPSFSLTGFGMGGLTTYLIARESKRFFLEKTREFQKIEGEEIEKKEEDLSQNFCISAIGGTIGALTAAYWAFNAHQQFLNLVQNFLLN